MTASHTMIERQVGHELERRGLTALLVGALVLALSVALGATAHPSTVDASHEIQ